MKRDPLFQFPRDLRRASHATSVPCQIETKSHRTNRKGNLRERYFIPARMLHCRIRVSEFTIIQKTTPLAYFIQLDDIAFSSINLDLLDHEYLV